MTLIKKIRYWYDHLNIQSKLATCILFAILTPFILLGGVFYNRLYDMISADTLRNVQEAASKTVPIVEARVSAVTEIANELATSEFFTLDTLDAFCDLAGQHVADDTVSAIKIYVDLPAEHTLFEQEQSMDFFVPMATIRGTHWYGIFQGTHAKALHCPPFYLGKNEKTVNGDCAYIIAKQIPLGNEVYPCYVAVYYPSEPISEILYNGISFPGSVSYIINEREALIASSDDYLTGMYYVEYSDINSYLMSSNSFIESNIMGENVYVDFNRLSPMGWFMVTVTPSSPLFYKTIKVLLEFAVACFFCIIFAYLFAMRQSKSITTRISSLAKQMAASRKGRLVSMPAPSVHDEVGELIETYNYMTARMSELMEQQKETAEELRIAEFNSLQAQINPHFLYNTMDMINWMALKGRTTEISSTVQQLARFYKLTLSRKSNYMSLEEELEHVSIYVELQNMRFENAFDFVVDIPDELLLFQIPKLTLQPIVENCIIHGILEKEDKKGTIVITGWRDNADYCLLISDDGVGIPPDRLPSILQGRKVGHSRGTNIAVYNTHKRLKILYGESYGLHYTSEVGHGTEVLVRIPALPLEDEM